MTYNYDLGDPGDTFLDHLETAARTVYGEARGESYDGQSAVANVIVNRYKNPGRWGHSLRSVCLKPYQFSCWNSNDPNARKIMQVGFENPMLRQCMKAVIEALDSTDDRSYGADHYLVTSLEPKPDWYDESKITVRIGNHTFLKLR